MAKERASLLIAVDLAIVLAIGIAIAIDIATSQAIAMAIASFINRLFFIEKELLRWLAQGLCIWPLLWLGLGVHI